MKKANRPVVTPGFTIVCDDIRAEDNGKLLIVGMYVGGITIEALKPTNHQSVASFMLNALTTLEVDRAGTVDFKVRITVPGEPKPLTAHGRIDIADQPLPNEYAPLRIGPVALKLWESGDVEIRISFNDQPEILLRKLPVVFRDIRHSLSKNAD